MTPLEQAWQEFVDRAGGRVSEGGPWAHSMFASTRESFEAGFAAGATAALPAKLTVELTVADETLNRVKAWADALEPK